MPALPAQMAAASDTTKAPASAQLAPLADSALESTRDVSPDRGPTTFGAVLHDLRATRGVSQAQLASRAGMDRSYVNRMEAGERGAPTPAATEALAKALDLSDMEVDRLFIAAGLLPRSLRALGANDPTILLLAQRLVDPRLSVASRAALRSTVETIARCWSNPVVATPASGQTTPERPARS
jgi:transcriptional regulator with XRE-family HTH domain